MRNNVGKLDKTIRIILGLAIGILGFYFKSFWGLIGVVPVATAFVNWCPLYVPFGIKTCRNIK